jgi:hypothetical protein
MNEQSTFPFHERIIRELKYLSNVRLTDETMKNMSKVDSDMTELNCSSCNAEAFEASDLLHKNSALMLPSVLSPVLKRSSNTLMK